MHASPSPAVTPAASRFQPFRTAATTVDATLGYIAPPVEAPYSYMYDPPAGTLRENFGYDLRRTAIADAREHPATPSIEREGFELWEAASAVVDFSDDRAVRRTYYAESAELALAVTGARRAHVFDHLVRQREEGRPALTMGRAGDGSKPAANGRVHCDYTEASGRRRLGLVINDVAAAAAVGRYAIINIWRSIGGPVLDTPLALCDARTVAATDLVPVEIRYQSRTGEIYLLRPSSRHRWCYFPEMDRHEALVFKQYDSQVNAAVRFTPHSAFDLPCVPFGAPLRQSIELRCLVEY